ncbi:uncharacterized protein [Montipora foliosa]|uniref:uncharacterized protein n=1 Tax=Montipora foliosa TaxID=591990 RepID=UPI0035F19216
MDTQIRVSMRGRQFWKTQNWQPVSFAERSTGSVGRPRFEMSKDRLEYLVKYELKTPDVAEALGVSISTIKRRLREFNISIRATLTEISDDDLGSVVRRIHTEFPNAGYRRVVSLHRIKVAQRRVRESMQRTDADGMAIRWLSITPRAVYCVSCPLALWHIDGNHKLIRWRIVIHGGVDGYTRIPLYLKANTSNSSDTVLNLFRQAVHEYGLLSRDEIQEYRIHIDGPFPDDHGDDTSVVEVPSTLNPLEQIHYRRMCTAIDPLRPSDCHGIDIYMEVLSFIMAHVAL